MTTNEESRIYSPLHNEQDYNSPPMKRKKLKKKRVKKRGKSNKSHKGSHKEPKKESQKTRRKGKKNSNNFKNTKRVGGGIVGSVSKSVSNSVGKAYNATKHLVKKTFRSKNNTSYLYYTPHPLRTEYMNFNDIFSYISFDIPLD